MISTTLIVLASLSILLATIGLYRMPDTMSKMHAATKASAFGVLLLALATAIEIPTGQSIFLCFAIVIVLYVTAPLACHAISSIKMASQRDDER